MILLASVLVAALVTPGATPTPCFPSIKFAGAVFLDTGQQLSPGQVGPAAGETDPNPVPCGLPDRVTVFHVSGRPATEQIAYRRADASYELFTSAGQSGFPAQGLLRSGVAGLAIVIILLVAVPAIRGHMRPAPDEVAEGPSP